MTIAFYIINLFGKTPFCGNPGQGEQKKPLRSLAYLPAAKTGFARPCSRVPEGSPRSLAGFGTEPQCLPIKKAPNPKIRDDITVVPP